MPNFSFVPLEGTIQNIRPFGDECCSSLVTLQTSEGTVTVVVSSDTYGQPFRCSLVDRLLIVYYTNATKSIPAQIVPRKIIVMC